MGQCTCQLYIWCRCIIESVGEQYAPLYNIDVYTHVVYTQHITGDKYTYPSTPAQVHIRSHTHTHMHVHIQIHTHTCTHTTTTSSSSTQYAGDMTSAAIYKILQNGFRKRHLTHDSCDSSLNFEPTFGS